ncbi:MAG: cyclic nucleotide-binding domain-containing protein [Desulfobacterales bacterium]|nr:cyclic nucleotide-binding domain-containing protein [Desulfobacterales bacterium]
MEIQEINIQVINAMNCKLYKNYDVISVKDHVIYPPQNKPICRSIARIILDYLKCYKDEEDVIFPIPYCDEESNCNGRLTIKISREFIVDETYKTKKYDKENDIVEKLSNVSFLKMLDKENIRQLIDSLKLIEIDQDRLIIKKGEWGKGLFIILSGKVNILGYENNILYSLKEGDVFGELSLITDSKTCADVIALQNSKLLYLDKFNFNKILNEFPYVQRYFITLLSKKVKDTTSLWEQLVHYDISGKIDEYIISEVISMLNQNQRTGELKLINLSNGTAFIHFKDGEIVNAKYNNKNDTDAVFDILLEEKGRFEFINVLPKRFNNAKQIAGVEYILVEASRRKDEQTS